MQTDDFIVYNIVFEKKMKFYFEIWLLHVNLPEVLYTPN